MQSTYNLRIHSLISICMSFRLIAVLLGSAILTGCGATVVQFKKSDPATTKVIEGPLVSVEVKRVPIALTTTEVASTAIAANNVGNSAVQGALLAVDVIDGIARPKYQNNAYFVILDEKTAVEETVILKNAAGNLKAHKPGHRMRAIYQGEGNIYLANLTVSPQLDEKTK